MLFHQKDISTVSLLFLGISSGTAIYLTKFKWNLDKVNIINQQIQEAQRVASIGSWVFNLENNDLTLSSEMYKIFEIQDPQPKDKLFECCRGRFHPDDLLSLDSKLENSRRTGEKFHIVFRLVFDGQRTKYIHAIGKGDIIEEKNCTYLVGTCQDRTSETLVQIIAEELVISEQKKFQEFFAAVNDCANISITNMNGEIVFANKKFQEISGYLEHELVGASHKLIKSGFHDEAFYKTMWDTISAGKVWQGEVCNRKKNGELYWENNTITSSFNDHGEIQYISVTIDITEKKRLELKAIDDDQLLRLALDNVGDGAWDWDLLNSSFYFSKRGKELLGYNESDIGDGIEEWHRLIHPADRENVIMHIQEHINVNNQYVLEYRMLCKNRKYKWILDRGTVINRDSNRMPTRIVGTHTDINRIKYIEEQLVQASKLQSLSEMSEGMAHEINNPLTIISATVKLLSRHDTNSEKYANMVNSITRSVERISKIITGLKKFAKKSDLNKFQYFSLARILRETTDLAEIKFKNNHVNIILDIKTESEIYCNQNEIEQVLINLINNSIDSIKLLSERWIKIEVLKVRETIVLRIIDSGPAIEDSVKFKIFDPFFTTKTTGEGMGLGLSIVKGVLDIHNANICVIPDIQHAGFEIVFNSNDK